MCRDQHAQLSTTYSHVIFFGFGFISEQDLKELKSEVKDLAEEVKKLAEDVKKVKTIISDIWDHLCKQLMPPQQMVPATSQSPPPLPPPLQIL